tara:strand:- start:11192 stop:11662 length:471 start_codon:yes stop_codon:yes gene_type:complete
MKRGPKPKPTAQLKLAGTFQASRRVEQEALPAAESLRPGQTLSARARRAWDATAPMLADNGILSEQDKRALACYCEAWARWVEARNTIATTGMWYTAASGNILKHPAVPIMETAATEMLRWSEQFGLTPSARTRIPRKEKTRTPAERLRAELDGGA